MRELRRHVTGPDRVSAEAGVVEPLLGAIGGRTTSGNIALAFALDGELSTEQAAVRLRALGFTTAYPAVTGGMMEFRRWDGAAPLASGPFGTVEPRPDPHGPIPTSELHAVIVPLVAFDSHCHRIGFGRGFYDRAFANPDRPLLVGVAFDIQELPEWEPEDWDVPLDVVITPTRTLRRR